MAYKTIVEDNIDILVAGAGLGGTGAAFEARYWGQDKKIVIAEKANIDRSGAVAQGLYAITATWEPASAKTTRKTTFAMREST